MEEYVCKESVILLFKKVLVQLCSRKATKSQSYCYLKKSWCSCVQEKLTVYCRGKTVSPECILE